MIEKWLDWCIGIKWVNKILEESQKRLLGWGLGILWMYLALRLALSPIVVLPDFLLGTTWAGSVILIAFSGIHCIATYGWVAAISLFWCSTLIGWSAEAMSVKYGIPFGFYHYTERLGPMIMEVPIVIPLAWFMMIYPSLETCRILLGSAISEKPWQTILLAALLMTAWGLPMDPMMVSEGYWVWDVPGEFFGTPLLNYFGWFLISCLILGCFHWFPVHLFWYDTLDEQRSAQRTLLQKRLKKHKYFQALPALIYLAMMVTYLPPSRMPYPALSITAFFCMGIPGLIAVLLVFSS